MVKVSKSNQERVVKDYDRNMVMPIFQQYYGYSDYFNLGYWSIETIDQAQASDNLVAMVLGCIPELKGTILDVACGMGASTRHLLKHYPPEAITGINYSGPQLARARENAPGVKFIRMDA
ncbi:MAG: methyltransferase domain-containing protein, partial [Actinomycetota bacterium]